MLTPSASEIRPSFIRALCYALPLVLALSLILALSLSSCHSTKTPSSSDTTVTYAGGSIDLPNTDANVLVNSPEPVMPVVVDSFMSDKVEVTSASRILALDRAGTLSRIVWSLGLGKNLVGRDISTDFPAAQSLPLVTPHGHSLNAESIIKLRPTVIITDVSVGSRPVIQQLQQTGIPVVYMPPERSLTALPVLVTKVAQTLGVEDSAPAVNNKITSRIEAASQRAIAKSNKSAKPRLAVLYIRGTSVAKVAGRGSGAPELIEVIGGIDAAAGSRDFVDLTSESLIKAAPDAVIVMESGLKSVGGIDGLLSIPGMKQTPAGLNRSVISVPDSLLLSFGPDVDQLIDALADKLYTSQD